jgi:hypothetical protein
VCVQAGGRVESIMKRKRNESKSGRGVAMDVDG